MHTVEYAPGRHADLFGEPSRPSVLLWHGTQTDSRAAVRVLAEAIAEHGIGVIAADWDSHAADGGRTDLLDSVRFALQKTAGADLVVVGWSLGGVAAAGLALRAQDLDVPVAHTVCLGGAFMANDPLSGGPVLDGMSYSAPRIPFTLLIGDADDVVPASASTEFAAALLEEGWPVEVVELAADHGSIAGARYDAAADRYEADDDPATLAVARAVATHIAAVAQNA
ncbi:alpha/beta hydrolase family protein [Mycolicibacterium diernhoferi]|uniref:Esterase n=1 Tax=Mycolicibacterium diernhoferi TaxID=1801 RepID=A0A1Q4HHR9_9MYCO|nr:esterase [Mycolicibacterium diernhoferi]OJZ67002.1 esterase [Mycolicibacterium diernhoferi]OPE53030.1 esterase [Mycolicibacterium diernhoferi]PEG52505.1 esterase [Mycolicibacterium diernhoferi]QYL23195.1 alpha/beta hydrolase [Mycolicibacterium diernhoferi]